MSRFETQREHSLSSSYFFPNPIFLYKYKVRIPTYTVYIIQPAIWRPVDGSLRPMTASCHWQLKLQGSGCLVHWDRLLSAEFCQREFQGISRIRWWQPQISLTDLIFLHNYKFSWVSVCIWLNQFGWINRQQRIRAAHNIRNATYTAEANGKGLENSWYTIDISPEFKVALF